MVSLRDVCFCAVFLCGIAPCLTIHAQKIYSCVNPKGQRLTSDRPITECLDREQRIYRSDGASGGILPPSLTPDERSAKEAEQRKRDQISEARQEAVRRDRWLMNRYTNEQSHQQAREAALSNVRQTLEVSQKRLVDAEKERKTLDEEAEFYKNKALPQKLQLQIDAFQARLDAQKSLIQTQMAEEKRINQMYDAELVRLKRLWAGAAPGSFND
jgi:hypothetical protein